MWTYDENAAKKYGLNHAKADTQGRGLGKEQIYTGGNSGYQVINLAYLLGAGKIILLGYDMQMTGGKSHWHGDHPRNLNRSLALANWVKNFKVLARDLSEAGVEVINATRETALDCFKRAKLEECL